MEKRLYTRDMTFDPAPESDEDNFAPQAFLPSPDPDPAEAVETEDWQADTHARLSRSLADLDDRSRDIVGRRWLTENKATLHELAAEYGVSAERIRQIETAALKKLRGLMVAA